jgi:hypothetical protein
MCVGTCADTCFKMLTHVLETESDELQKEDFLRLYECTKPNFSFEVLPITHILGKLPIMVDVCTPSIPSHYYKQEKEGFPRGHANSAKDKQDGSKLYYVNHFGMTWSRSKLSLHR